jgi:hypothetical protein
VQGHVLVQHRRLPSVDEGNLFVGEQAALPPHLSEDQACVPRGLFDLGSLPPHEMVVEGEASMKIFEITLHIPEEGAVASLASLVPLSGKPPASSPFERLNVSGENRSGGKSGGEGIAEANGIGAIGPILTGPDVGSVPSRIHSTLGSGSRESTEEAEEGKYPVGGGKNGGDPSNEEDEELDDEGGWSGGCLGSEEDEELDDEVRRAEARDGGGAKSMCIRSAYITRCWPCTAGRFKPLETTQGSQGTPTGAKGGMVASGGALSD